jgi:ABC-type sugar transport system substrate-binding protein
MKKAFFLLFATTLLFALAGCNQGKKQMTIAMMPKSKGNAYFIACKKGAEEAA